jgi:hypothetical protein
MKTLLAVSAGVVAALVLALFPVPVGAGQTGFQAVSVFPKPVDHWAHWGKPAHGHIPHGRVHRPIVPHVVVPRPVVILPQVPVFVHPRRVWVSGFWAWGGHYWVWVPGYWR